MEGDMDHSCLDGCIAMGTSISVQLSNRRSTQLSAEKSSGFYLYTWWAQLEPIEKWGEEFY